jgi:predicted dehydrogenase
MNKIRVGILGSGFVAMTHAEALRYDPRAELVAIAGGSRAPALAKDYSVNALTSIHELIRRADVDAVIVCTPHHLHAEAAIAAARAGKHVLVEKPMATSAADCRSMIEAAEEHDVRLMIAHFQRYRKTNAAVKRAIDEGLAGRIYLINESLIEFPDPNSPWKNQPESKGFLLGYGVHAIDQMRWWLNSEVASVTAHCGRYLGRPVEDGSLLLLQFENGANAVLECTNALPFVGAPGSPGAAEFHANLIGEKAILDINVYGEVKLKRAEGEVLLADLPSWTDAKSFARIEAYAAQDHEFISSILERRPPAIPGEEGLANVRVCLAAYRSADEKRTVFLREEPLHQNQ